MKIEFNFDKYSQWIKVLFRIANAVSGIKVYLEKQGKNSNIVKEWRL